MVCAPFFNFVITWKLCQVKLSFVTTLFFMLWLLPLCYTVCILLGIRRSLTSILCFLILLSFTFCSPTLCLANSSTDKTLHKISRDLRVRKAILAVGWAKRVQKGSKERWLFPFRGSTLTKQRVLLNSQARAWLAQVGTENWLRQMTMMSRQYLLRHKSHCPHERQGKRKSTTYNRESKRILKGT